MSKSDSDIMGDLPDLGVAETFRAISVCRAAGISALIWGPPGVGKSSMIAELPRVFKEAPDGSERDENNPDDIEPFEVIIGSISDPTELMGFPSRSESDDPNESDVIEFLPRSWAQRCVDYGAGVVFLDELTTCPPAVQKTMLQLVFGNKAGDLQLPKDTYIVAAANPTSTITAGHNLDPALANRFAHFVMDPAQGDGNKFFLRAMSNPYDHNWDELYADVPKVPEAMPDATIQKSTAALSSYLHSTPGIVSPAGTENAGAEGFMAYPTRRSWEAVFKLLEFINPLGSDSEKTFASYMISSLVGTRHAQMVMTFMENLDLPDPLEVLKNPKKFPVETYKRTDQKYAILSSLVSITRSTINDNSDINKAVDYYMATVEWAEMLDKDAGSAEIVVIFLQDLIRMFAEVKGKNLGRQNPDKRIIGLNIKEVLPRANASLDLFKSLD